MQNRRNALSKIKVVFLQCTSQDIAMRALRQRNTHCKTSQCTDSDTYFQNCGPSPTGKGLHITSLFMKAFACFIILKWIFQRFIFFRLHRGPAVLRRRYWWIRKLQTRVHRSACFSNGLFLWLAGSSCWSSRSFISLWSLFVAVGSEAFRLV